ncbi:MAG: hypothetical protein QNL33_18185 [Akkermansiaceae bacterium]
MIDLGIADTNGAALGFGTGAGLPRSSWLTVIGPDATIMIDSIQMRNATNGADTNVVRFTFDETGVSTIQLTGDFVYDGSNATSVILSGGILDVDYTGTVEPTVGQRYDLMTGDLILNDGTFSLDTKDAANWSLAIVGTGVLGDSEQDVLRLTFLGGPILGTRLVGYWPFYFNVSPQADHSGFKNHATANSGTTSR